ncbi:MULTISPECIES: alpha/beta fold hydrolase [Streptomyces]|uniref:Alpha/beta hydrolase n=2 Tax=Streptomyces fradiae TaxID=1906 RepID=A0A1Y2NPL9_STRFR|nr:MULTISPECIES: alpha/beta hydrolase [Streptomyces]KAF0649387.1 alpha/beta hydrolase [Streptomyces fradiae ATCC 10745 = DSM 40063]OSY48997.1 Haloacetate dehalogenase H-1 [Streptomyces fradiae ATCC 10745 = DSM 40063]QEV14496.1 alpha/beta hydrolase [Streptomyces fradiae ATCC 10745 = DSM 40063]
MTEFLDVDGGTIAYEVAGDGPLVVLAHGMGDHRDAYRAVVPRLVAAGYRVAAVDLRGCGESSTDWPDWSRAAIAGDLLAVIRHLGGPAVLVGHSISGGAATIAAAREPELVGAVVELAPFTRRQTVGWGDLRSRRWRQGMLRLLGATVLGSVPLWRSYLEAAYPGVRPAHFAERLDRVEAMLREPGRMKALRAMGRTTPADAGAQLGRVRCPVLVVMGTDDPDWADPRAEGTAVVGELPPGLGRLDMIEGAGHYPHDQYPDQVVSLMLSFLRTDAARA